MHGLCYNVHHTIILEILPCTDINLIDLWETHYTRIKIQQERLNGLPLLNTHWYVVVERIKIGEIYLYANIIVKTLKKKKPINAFYNNFLMLDQYFKIIIPKRS